HPSRHTTHSPTSSRHHRHLLSFPTRRSSDLSSSATGVGVASYTRDRGSIARRPSPTSSSATRRRSRSSRCRRSRRRRTSMTLIRSEEHTSELQSRFDLVCRLLLEKKKTINYH